jgi:hypothetical protein
VRCQRTNSRKSGVRITQVRGGWARGLGFLGFFR